MKKTSQILTLILLCFAFALPAQAARVAKVKGKKLLITLEGDPAKEGDIYYTLAPNGKRAGIIKILKIKGDQAIGILGKGRALPGFGLEYRPPKGTQVAQPAAPTPPPEEGEEGPISPEPMDETASTSDGKMYWGFIGGVGLNNMDVDLKDTNGDTRATASLSGTSFSAKGLFDYNIFDQVWFRGMGGMEGFNASGPSNCGDAPNFNQACNAEIMYLAIDLWGRYLFSMKDFRPWVGGGFSLLFPMTKKATALEEGSITNTSVMALGAGFDWFVSPTLYIPFSVEYGLLPESDDVSANLIAIRVGVGFPF